MHLRRWLLPGVLLTLFAAAVILPATDLGREWLLERAVSLAEELGYEIDYSRSSGNPWFGVDLNDATVVGPGVDLGVRNLSIDYFLPSLITGDLPLSIELSGVRGSVDPGALAALGGGGGSSGWLITPRLRDLAVRDVAVEVDGTPWTLPAVDLQDVMVGRTEGAIGFAVTVVSPEGEARLEGDVATDPWRLELEIEKADVRLARHWWDGAIAGTLEGRLVADSDGVTGTGHVNGGEIRYLGSPVESISGPVRYGGGIVEANLAGRALGGPVTADIEVNVPATYWEGTIQGTPDLAPLAGWLAMGEFDTESLGITGTARVELHGSGWTEVALSGRGAGDGTLLGYPLDELIANFGYASDSGVSVEASATLAGGPVVMTLRPSDGSSRLQLAAQAVGLTDGLEAEWSLAADFTEEGTLGSFEGTVEGALAGRGLSVEADGSLDEDGLQLFVRGEDELGATAEGAAVLVEGSLEGRVTVENLSLPALAGPVDLSLGANGPLEALPLQLRLGGAGTSQLAAFGISVDEEFSGSASGVLSDGSVRNLAGTFGPLTLSGELDLSPIRFDGKYRLADVETSGAVEARLTSDGTVAATAEEVHGEGGVQLERLAAAGVVLGETALTIEASGNPGGGLLLALESTATGDQGEPRLSLELTEDSFALEANELRLTLAGRPTTVAGSVVVPSGGTPSADVTVRSEELLLRLQPSPGAHLIQLSAAPGLDLGGLTLRRPLEASGRVSDDRAAGRLQGTIAGSAFAAGFSRNGATVSVDATLGGSEGFGLEYDLGSGAWAYSGTLSLEPVAEAVGVPVEGSIAGEMTRDHGYSGQLNADVVIAGVPVELRARGNGVGLDLEGAARIADVPWQLTGDLQADAEPLDAAHLTLTSGLGSIRLDGSRLEGSGRLPPRIGPLATSGDEWFLQGDLGDGRVTLATPGSRAVLDWSTGAGIEAEIDEAFELAGIPGSVDASVRWREGQAGDVCGTLRLAGEELALSGDLDDLALSGTLDASTLGRQLLGSPLLSGVIEVNASVPTADPTSAHARFDWRAGEAVLEGSISAHEVTVGGAGLQASYSSGRFALDAQGARLDPFLAASLTGLSVDGELSRSTRGGWEGELDLRGSLPLPGAPTATATLTGTGGTLALRSEAASTSYTVRAEGALLPALDLAVSGSAAEGTLVLAGTASGTPAAPTFEGLLETEPLEVGPLGLPGLTLTVERTADGRITLSGDRANLQLAGGHLAGELTLPFELAGEPHELAGTVSGTASSPRLEMRIGGPLASGSAVWEDESGSAVMTLLADPWLPGPISAREPTQLELTVDRSLDWIATLTAPLEAADEPLVLTARVNGSRLSYRGRAELVHAALPAESSLLIGTALEGRGDRWQLTSDLAATAPAAIAEFLPLPSRLATSGSLSVAPGPLITVDGELSGTLDGRPLTLSLDGDSAGAVSVTGSYAGTGIEGRVRDTGIELAVTGAPGLDVRGRLGWRDGLDLALEGVAEGAEVEATGNYDPATRSGRLEATVAGTRVQALARPAAEPATLEVTANVSRPAGNGEYRAETDIELGPGGAFVESLMVDWGGWQAEAAGPLLPAPGLKGEFSTSEGLLGSSVEATFQLTGPSLSRPKLRVTAGDLVLLAERAEEGWRAAISGNGELARSRISADLAWRQATGFAGTASLRIPSRAIVPEAPASQIDVELSGNGPLSASFALHAGTAEPLATGTIRLGERPWRDPTMSGGIAVATDAQTVWPDYPGEPLALSADLTIGGTPWKPVVTGPLAIGGALEGTGRIGWEVDEGALELAGDSFSLTANATSSGGFGASLSVSALELGALWPAAAGALVEAEATVSSGPGGHLSGELTTLEVTSGSSRIVGSAKLSDTLDARLRLDLNLTDLPVALTDLSGTLAGTVELAASSLGSLTSGTLRGDLQLAEATVPGTDTRLSGQVELSGEAGDPALELDLDATGGASGDLLLAARPAQGSLRIDSDLTWGEIASRFEVEATTESLSAAGAVTLPAGEFTLSTPGDSRELLLEGEGAYRDWFVRFDTDTYSLELHADLSTLGVGASGQISASASQAQEGPWLKGIAAGLAWGGLEVGDVTFTSLAPTAPIHLEGEAVEARFDPFSGPEWRVGRLELPLPNGLRVSGSGAGSGSELSARLLVSGGIAGAPVELPLHVEKQRSGPLTFAGSGALLEGTVTVEGSLSENGWQGEIGATRLQAGGLDVDLTGLLSGDLYSPTLALEGSGEAAWASLDVRSTLSAVGWSLDALVVSPYLEDPVTLEGSSQGGGSLALATDSSRLEIADLAGTPTATGALALDARGVRLAAQGTPSNSLELRVSVPALPGFTLAATLDRSRLGDFASLRRSPVTFAGRSATSGTVTVELPQLQATVNDLGYVGQAFGFELAGLVGPTAATDLSGTILVDGSGVGLFASLPDEVEIPFVLGYSQESIEFASGGELGTARLLLDLAAGSGKIDADLELGAGHLRANVDFLEGRGPAGSISASGLPLLLLADQEPLLLTGEFDVSPEVVDLNAQLQAAGGSVLANGTIGLGLLLPDRFAPSGTTARNLELQLGTFDLGNIPWVVGRLPHLRAPLSGFLQLFGNRVVGRVVAPDMAAAGDPLPLSIDISGTTEEVTISGLLAGSPIQVTANEERVGALFTFERFPLHLLAQAATGPHDVTAEVTGVGRFELPLAGDEGPVVEIATELVRLERAGVVTTGNVSLTFVDGELSVNEARFSGGGTWRASGAIRRDRLDLRLSATDADFGPLLGLVPLFAQYEVGASGSLELVTSGTLTDPVMTLTTAGLDFEIAGSSYRLVGGQASLRDELLELTATVEGIRPFTGRLQVAGSGHVDLLPLSLGDASFEATGNALVPGLGEIEAFEATLTSAPGEPLRIEGTGSLGEQFTLVGTLVPLDLTLEGDDLAIRLPYLLLASAQVDARLRMQWLDSLRFSGGIGVDQALFELGIRPPTKAESSGPNPVAQQVVFDAVSIEAPGRVRFMENFGSAETSLDLVLDGSAARPTLSGTAQVLRGTIRFSGRDFDITAAQARFDPSRGLLPIVDVTAVTSFDVDEVIPADGSVRFVVPEEGRSFQVVLSFTGELESTAGAEPPFRLDLTPALTSEALIQEVRADGSTTPPRPLTEPELLSLITLGRLDLGAPLASEAGLAGAVAEGAIDTAVDLLLVSELQNALAEALGVDLVEIDTTAISSIFGRSPTAEPFSVSLRLGGYLTDEVFASYRIGTFDDVEGLYALTNEVNLVYDLGPVEIDLAGRVNFEDSDSPTPDAEVSATVRYDFSPLTAIEGGIDLSDERQQVRFGVTLRW
ncbi:MAG TPA: translocation/assembly module TamB domain-containing protein [Trueperaceae bacterium]